MALRVEERIVSGGPSSDEVLVHHLTLRGANRQIGRHLAELVRGRYGVSPAPLPASPCGLAWMAAHAAPLLERARGAAEGGEAWCGREPVLTRLGAPAHAARGAAAFVPAALTGGGPLLARAQEAPDAVQDHPLPLSRPYVLELHPDDGLPSLALVAFDLLGGVLDGVNAAGLAVVAVPEEQAAPPSLDGLQLARVVLDGCASTEDARDLLLATASGAAPTIWILADQGGSACVVEHVAGRARVHWPERPDGPLLFAHRALRALRTPLAAEDGPWTPAALDAAWAQALADAEPQARTMWRGVYDLCARALEIRFLAGAELPAPMTLGLRFELAA